MTKVTTNYRSHFKLIAVLPPCRFYPKWPLKPLPRLMPCWEINHTQRKSCVLEDANLSEWWCFKKMKKTRTMGNIAFCSAVYSTTCMFSATLCFQYVRISILRSTLCHVWKKNLSIVAKKKKTLHRLLTANSSQTNYFYRGGGWSWLERQVSAFHRDQERLKDIQLLSEQIWL